MGFIADTDDVRPLAEQARVFSELMNSGQEHAAAIAPRQMFAQLGTALHLYDAFVPDKRFGFGKLFGQLRIEVGAVGNHANGRAGKGRTANQHTG